MVGRICKRLTQETLSSLESKNEAIVLVVLELVTILVEDVNFCNVLLRIPFEKHPERELRQKRVRSASV